jgi:restriction endonuclease S subunit
VIIDSEEVTSIDGETTYDKGTDYEINYGDGNIKVLSSGSMEDNKMYYIDLKYVKKINLGDYYGSGSKDNTSTVQSFGMWGEL